MVSPHKLIWNDCTRRTYNDGVWEHDSLEYELEELQNDYPKEFKHLVQILMDYQSNSSLASRLKVACARLIVA